MATSFYLEHLSETQLHALTQYKYQGEDRSITYKYVLGPFYSWLINYMPMSIAPNTITLVGFLLTASAHLLLMYHSPDLKQTAPNYVYLLGGAALFIYMVLDNLDGKQARRTKSSSPLGQLFDHGCDALNVTLSGMSLLATIQVGANVMSMSVLFFLGHVMLFGATLEEYHTGAMVLRELNGPNEGLLTLVACQLVTGVVGPAVWSTPIQMPWTGGVTVELKYIMYYLAVPPTVTAVLGNAWGIGQWNRRNGKSVGRAVWELGREFWSMSIFGVVFNSWAVLAPGHFARQTVGIMWLSGGVMFDLISRMMLAHLARAPYPYMPGMVWAAVGCWGNAVLGERGAAPVGVDALTTVCVVATGAYNVWRVWCLVTQLCDFLNVGCFSLRRPRDETSGVGERRKE